MEEDEHEVKPHGYIYIATNMINGKVYIGQTTSGRWKENQNPVEERWKEEVDEAFRRSNRATNLRYVENAIVKYGPENFKVVELDTANSLIELDEKETYWINEHDSMNPEMGYNLREGGLGGRFNDQAREKLSNVIAEKYQTDSEYYDKQAKERKERANNPEWVEKMTEINQEIARDPETREKMSNSLKEQWKDKKYQDRVSTGVSDKWKEKEYQERQLKAKTEGKREIPDKKKFLKEINELPKKDLIDIYDMDGKCINRRISEMLGHQGVNNFSEAKKYLENKDLKDVFKDIKEKLSNQPERPPIKKEISDRKQFLQDIQNMKQTDLTQKYDMDRTTIKERIQEMLGHHGVYNYTEARKYLDSNNINDVVKGINEKLSNPSERYQRTKEIADKKQILQDVQTMKKSEINYKYGICGKTTNRKIENVFEGTGIEVKNYSEAKKFLKDKNLDEVLKDINKDVKEEKNEEKSPDDTKEGAQTEEKPEEALPYPHSFSI